MKKLLVDTNIVIDLLAKREPYYSDSANLFSLADKKYLTLSVSSLTFANTNYILLKSKSANEAENQSYKICEWCGKPGTLVKMGWWTTRCPEHGKT